MDGNEPRNLKNEIKLILTALDVAYPSEGLNFKAFQEKVYLRKKILDCMHNISKYLNIKED